MLGRAGIPVNIKDVSKKGREKIRTKINLYGQIVQYKSAMQKEKKNGKIKIWIVLKNFCKLKMLNNYCKEG
jgi:hypothetical protein